MKWKHEKFFKILFSLVIVFQNCDVINIRNLFWNRNVFFRVFTNGSGDKGSIPGRDKPKTQKMVLEVSLLKA